MNQMKIYDCIDAKKKCFSLSLSHVGAHNCLAGFQTSKFCSDQLTWESFPCLM